MDTLTRYNRHAMPDAALQGSFRILFLYDVCEEIHLDRLRDLVGVDVKRLPPGRPASPEYIRFERPPLIHPLGQVTVGDSTLPGGGIFSGEVNYYEYGAVSVKLEVPFSLTWPELVSLSSRWIASQTLEAAALQLARKAVEKAKAALVKPNAEWLTEDYYIIHLLNEPGADGTYRFRGAELIAQHGGEIAQIVRGESAELSAEEQREILANPMSYYPHDLMVAGWNAAFLCDTAAGAIPSVQLLEYANTQLLEFRYYDAALSRVLERVHGTLGRRGLFRRWRLAREAQGLNQIRLDVRELTEKMDTSIKFLSDMFSTRQYRMAAARIGVEDYRRLVESKLHTAGDLYTFLMDQFNASRGFVLELIVVIILVIELGFFFVGKT